MKDKRPEVRADVYKRQAYTTYGTSRANAYKILEDSLNLRDVRIYDTIEDADGKERRVLNAKETTLAAQKPVSYTHLDVYKRQQQCYCGRNRTSTGTYTGGECGTGG